MQFPDFPGLFPPEETACLILSQEKVTAAIQIFARQICGKYPDYTEMPCSCGIQELFTDDTVL